MRIAGREFTSRLILGTGGFPRLETLADAIRASGTELVTVAMRRIDPGARGSLVDVLDDCGVRLLPNTAGCYTARDAGPRGVDPYYGWGVLDAAHALGAPIGTDFPAQASGAAELIDLITAIRAARAESGVEPAVWLDALIWLPEGAAADAYEALESAFSRLARVRPAPAPRPCSSSSGTAAGRPAASARRDG